MDASIRSVSAGTLLRRTIGILYGFGNQALFLVTVWYLFWFLRDGDLVDSADSNQEAWLLRDCGLAVFFALSHSVMLFPRTRKLLTRLIPSPFYDSTFCVVTCVSLLLLFFGWRQSPYVLWNVDGSASVVIHLLFYVSWAALIYSLALTGLGYQNGWTPFYYWLRRQPAPRREFRPQGAYKWIRHPVYLSFLGLVWFTPRMSLDHLTLTLIWTAYIFYGSVLKDRRLEFFLGRAYVEYQRKVPGFPLMFRGPLGRRQHDDGKATESSGAGPSTHHALTRTAA